ncbi:MAG: response regulator [Rubrivivax sp.]|nr:response regulator [Rubrivivax sp.]
MLVSIRSRLLTLVLAVLLPGLLGAAWLVGRTFQAERDAHERTLRETSRALSQVIDAELTRRATLARVLAQSPQLANTAALSRDDLVAFEAQARRALEGLDGWIELRAPHGVLLDTRVGLGRLAPVLFQQQAPPQPRQPPQSPQAPQPPQLPQLPQQPPPAVRGAAVADLLLEVPVVQPLRRASDPDNAHAAIVQPVQRDGRTVYNLVITVRPLELQRIVDRQRLPKDWVGAVLDNLGVIVARVPGGLQHVGARGTPDELAAIARSNEGLFLSVTLDGHEAAGFFSTAPNGWSFVIAMPRAQYDGWMSSAVIEVAVGALLLLGLAVAGAMWVARSIVGPVQALKLSAQRLQAGRPVEYLHSGIAECDAVSRTLSEAALTLQRSRAELEHQVGQAVARTRQAEQRVAQSQRVEALGRLTGGVAHDFNNLLGVISNSAHLIERHAKGPELQVPVAATLRAVEVGSRLTQHLLRFAGRRPLQPQVLQLARYLQEVQELMKSVLGRQVVLSVQVAPDTRAVHVDASELELALINLALNARDVMAERGGELRLRARNALPEECDALEPGPYVLITVGDDGPGMPAESMDRVFEPFFTTKGVGKGTGLGLSQVHGFAVQAGGTARLDSTPGIGTTVSMLLPAAVAEAADGAAPLPTATAQPLPSSPSWPSTSSTTPAPTGRTSGPASGTVHTAAAASAALSGTRVLLVEDNDELAGVTVGLLRSHGAAVQRAAEAAEALVLLGLQERFDIVLSDVVMPGTMDGVALARQLWRERPELPVVLISGYGASDAAREEFTVLRKPCAPDELLSTLQAALASSTARNRAAAVSSSSTPAA